MSSLEKHKIDGRYEIVKVLGDGLSGEVLLVKDHEGQKALKFLKKVQLNVSREEALRNFKNEFSILKELNHPNIARILDFGFDTRLQKYYFTSEFVSGALLDKACENQPFEVVEKLVIQVLRALNYLHSRGTYHFDIKPQNVLVTMVDGKPETAKIIDFGLAGYASPRKRVGTPAYMAPEVIQGGVLDGRTDLYSTGVMLYKVFTGVNPFAHKSLKDTLESHVHLVPEHPTKMNASLPEYWEHIVMRLLEKNPVNRYSQASLVIRDLNYLSHRNFDVETSDTKLSYLPEKGTLIGREKEWKIFIDLFGDLFLGGEKNEGASCRLLIITGEKGAGKTRMLSEIKYYSQLANIPVKTIRQLLMEGMMLHQFVLLADEDEAEADDINSLRQELRNKNCLIVWGTEKVSDHLADTTVLDLKNYTKEQLRLYIESVTGLQKTPDRLIHELFARTQGNPLLVTEFVKALLQQDLLFDKSGKWDAATFEDIHIDFNKLFIPETVEEYLSARFKGLPPENLDFLKWLAVHGEELTIENFKVLINTRSLPEGELQRIILSLVESELIKKTSREHTYYFSNSLYRDIILKQIQEDDLVYRHECLANLFESNEANRKFYLYHAGYSPNHEKSLSALRELAKIYMEDHKYAEEAEVWERALKLVSDKMGREWIDVSFHLYQACVANNQRDKALETAKALKKYIDANSDITTEKDRSRVLQNLVSIYIILGKLDDAESIFENNRSYWMEDTHRVGAVLLKNYYGFLKFKRGEIDEAEKVFLETHAIWNERLTDEERLLVKNNRLVEVYLLRKKFKDAVVFCLQSIALLEKLGPSVRLALLYYWLGDLYYRLTVEGENGAKTDYTQMCLDSFQKCEKIAREIGDYNNMLRAFNGIGNVYYEKEQKEEALQYYERALAIARKYGDLTVAATLALNVGNIYLKLEKLEDAYSHFIYAINTLESIDNKLTHNWLHLNMCYFRLADFYRMRHQFEKVHHNLDKIDENIKDKPYLIPHLFEAYFIRLKTFYDEERDADFNQLLPQVKELATAVNDKNELENYLKSIGHQDSNKDAVPVIEEIKMEGKVLTSNNQSIPGDDDLKKIIEINNFINSERDVSQLLKLVLNYALQLSQAEAGFVVLADDEGTFVPACSLNAEPGDEEKVSMSIIKMALETGEIVTSSDAVKDSRFDGSESVVMNELKSILCLPIKSKNKGVGAFYLDNRYRTNVFANCNVVLLKAFCDQVGIALENAKLIDQLKRAQDQLEQKLQKTEKELADVKNLLVEESGVFQAKYSYDSIISKSKEMREVFKLLDKVTETNLSVFIHGESGTGKELVAKALHYNNPTRVAKKFVAINCGAIPASLMESELFGHKMGSFTGAVRDKKGMFEEANGGTLFLDEIGELAPELQVKLLRVLQEGEVQRIGDAHSFKVDVRIVSASLKDIEVMVKAGKFREDLYYRLCQMRINLPALRERKEDVPTLAKHFVKKYCQQNKIDKILEIPSDFMKALLDYDWSGNVRELENTIYVACALQDGGSLHLQSLPDHYGIKKARSLGGHDGLNINLGSVATGNREDAIETSNVMIDENNRFDPQKTWREYESLILAKCYEKADKKKKVVSDQLDLSHSTVYKKIEEMDLDNPAHSIFKQNFVYDIRYTMKDYVGLVFQAALKHHGDHPYAAIRQLAVSQGYFYKIIKQVKNSASIDEVAVAK